jgi:hypothetical protein
MVFTLGEGTLDPKNFIIVDGGERGRLASSPGSHFSTSACFCRHIFSVPEEHERRMSGQLHFVQVRKRPEKQRKGALF